MRSNDTYTSLDLARRLHVLGDWDHAAALLADDESTEALELKAEILYERFLFRADGIDAASDAIAALDPRSPQARLRRSLHLRSASGLRPQIAAAQLLLAAELPADDPERSTLIETARNAADELGLTWVRTDLEKLATQPA